MKRANRLLFLINCCTLATLATPAATLYVWQDSPSPGPPYYTWLNAATSIQDAVDAADPGDTVVVSGGIYDTGGRASYGMMTNRVVIDKAITVESLMGPEVTIIQGHQVPGTTNGDEAIRCVYLTDGAVLSGFTLTRGATRILGDWQQEQTGGGVWCQSASGRVTNCTITSNAALDGGGAGFGTLNRCTITSNSASSGGGVVGATLNDCVLTGNLAESGGGASSGTLNNCTLTGNSASWDGGGARYCALNNCTLTANSAKYGGGTYFGTLSHCNLTGNSAREYGGGAYGGTLNNCIAYYNAAPFGPNYYYYDWQWGITLNYCCTTPDPDRGVGNLTAEPQLASPSHLSAGSPCRGAGSAADAPGPDIDGEPWLSPPSIGCDEYHADALTGPLTVGIIAAWTNVAVGFMVDLTGWNSGRVAASAWDFGDGTVLSNRPYASHAWSAPGNYAVVLRAYNESHPAGVIATVLIRVVAAAGALRVSRQRQPDAAPRFMGDRRADHPGRGGCHDAARRAGVGDQRSVCNGGAGRLRHHDQPGGRGPAGGRAEYEWPGGDGHPRLPGAGNDQWRRGHPMRVPEQPGAAERVHPHSGGHAHLGRLVPGAHRRRGLLRVHQRAGHELHASRQFGLLKLAAGLGLARWITARSRATPPTTAAGLTLAR